MPHLPPGHVDLTGAVRVTGYSRRTIQRALYRNEIPGAFQRAPGSPWRFTVEGLQSWMRGETQRVAS